ncbi:MAG: hypothetical protein ABMA64_02325 [Myxococcota bacterium]
MAAYREALAPLERDARDEPWADRRPWRVATHVGWDGALPVVDLHDLGAALARRAVRAVMERPPSTGAVVFVFGAGRHTVAAGPVLRKVVERELRAGCSAEPRWSYRLSGSARWVWVSDRERAPAAALGGAGGVWGRVFAGLLLAAVLFAVLRAVTGVDGCAPIR